MKVDESRNRQGRAAASGGERQLPLLSRGVMGGLRKELRDVVEYRKSGLSLNHIVGCPLDCAYCVRHLFDGFALRDPQALMPDRDAARLLTEHRYFVSHQTPLQLLNRATDPFLPQVRPHMFAVLEALDARGFRNHMLIITRYHVREEDCERLNELKSLRTTLLVTYSGIDDPALEPVASEIAVRSLQTAYRNAKRYRVVLYWRPLVPGANDSVRHIERAAELSHSAHATVFSGLFYRPQMQAFYRERGLAEPYTDPARRKILPADLERRIIREFQAKGGRELFRKTSCGVAASHGEPDYNGHVGIREVCDICPQAHVERCLGAHRKPDAAVVLEAAAPLGPFELVELGNGAAVVRGFDEQQRYFLQHRFGFQFHDEAHPHHLCRHGRADIGWTHAR